MDELTTRRLKHNEELFRSINDEVNEAHADERGRKVAYLCECSDRNCTERVHLTEGEYEAIRQDERRFVIVPGHEIAAIEDVVERHDDHEIVEKHEAA